MSFFLVEILFISLFAFLFVRELIRKKGRTYELLAGAIFGFLLEFGLTQVSHAYEYAENFKFFIFNIPLMVPLAWAVIFYLAMAFTDQFEINWKVKPFADALIALNLDLAMDTIAIRLHFWHWLIPLNQEWYGVPFENLAGWIIAALVFSFLIRTLRRIEGLNFGGFIKKIFINVSKLIAPFLAFVLFMFFLSLYAGLSFIPFHANRVFKIPELFSLYKKFSYPGIFYQPEVQLWKLIILVFMVSQLISISFYFFIKHGRVKKIDWLSFSLLTILHSFFLIAYFATGMFIQAPFLLFVALAMLGLHFFLHLFLPFGLINLSWFRKIKSRFPTDLRDP